MRLRFSRRAELDVREIGDFISRDNPQRALSFVRQLRTRCRQLTHFPETAPSRSQYGLGVRMTAFGRYLILYVVQQDAVETLPTGIRRSGRAAMDKSATFQLTSSSEMQKYALQRYLIIYRTLGPLVLAGVLEMAIVFSISLFFSGHRATNMRKIGVIGLAALVLVGVAQSLLVVLKIGENDKGSL